MRTSQNTNRKGNHKIFPKYMQEKLAITVLVITLALFALVVVLYNLMTKKKDDYNQIVLTQQEYDSRILPFRRGDIMDRNGTYLATSEKVYNLIIDPKLILSEADKYLDASITALVECFGYDRAEIANLINEKKDKQYVRYARQLSYEQREAFETYKKQKTEEFSKARTGQAIKGITFEDEYKRVYPYHSLASHVIGFASGDGLVGTGGVEQYYNDVLMGTNGREYGYLNDQSNLERVIKPPVNGNNLVVTIDANIQKIVDKYIAEWEAETGSKRVGVVVMDPNNGEVLAMSSDRQFDLNHPRELTSEYTDEVILGLGRKEAVDDYYRKHKSESGFRPITEEQASQFYSMEQIMGFGKQVAWNQIWRNFAVSDTYEPGSPSKILTVAAALEEGVISPTETFECHGYLEVGNWPIKCVAYRRGGHGTLTAEQGLMVSCNVVMMQIAQRMGKDIFYKYQQLFGIGSKTGIDLPGEADAKSLLYTAETADAASLATNSFGQNFNCTMIQMAAAYSSIINGGSYYEPHVVKQIQNEKGAVVDKKEPRLVRETVSESTSKFINEALWKTVNYHPAVNGGTGGSAAIEGYDIAGKTGTAEKVGRDKTNYLLSFAGYAPAYDPQVFIYVVVDEPNVEDQAHSTFAGVIFQKIMKDVLPYMNIFPNGDIPEDPEVQDQLPKEEGISESTAETAEGETKAGEETLAPETSIPDIEDDFNSGAPNMLPTQAGDAGAGTDAAPESTESEGQQGIETTATTTSD